MLNCCTSFSQAGTATGQSCKTSVCFRYIQYTFVLSSVSIFVSPCVGGSKVPPRTLYRIKCVLAEILYGCQKQNGGFYVAREKLLQASLTQDTDKSRHRRHRPTGEGTSRRPYAEAHAQSRAYRPTSLPRFAVVGFRSNS